jgi:hypothetical protein
LIQLVGVSMLTIFIRKVLHYAHASNGADFACYILVLFKYKNIKAKLVVYVQINCKQIFGSIDCPYFCGIFHIGDFPQTNLSISCKVLWRV